MNTKQVQLNLKHNGYFYKGEIDGIVGPQTCTAIEDFQVNCGLKPDSIVGIKTTSRLLFETKCVQYLINCYGYSPKLVVDGLVGDKTILAIKWLQCKFNEKSDGLVGISSRKIFDNILTPNFTPTNDPLAFKCHCGNNNPVNYRIRCMLEFVRERTKSPIIVTSGKRCPICNKQVGGVANSVHLKGLAVDFHPKNTKLSLVKQWAIGLGANYSYYGTKGMGNAIHVNY